MIEIQLIKYFFIINFQAESTKNYYIMQRVTFFCKRDEQRIVLI